MQGFKKSPNRRICSKPLLVSDRGTRRVMHRVSPLPSPSLTPPPTHPPSPSPTPLSHTPHSLVSIPQECRSQQERRLLCLRREKRRPKAGACGNGERNSLPVPTRTSPLAPASFASAWTRLAPLNVLYKLENLNFVQRRSARRFIEIWRKVLV